MLPVDLLTYVGLPGRGDGNSHTEVAVRLLRNKHVLDSFYHTYTDSLLAMYTKCIPGDIVIVNIIKEMSYRPNQFPLNFKQYLKCVSPKKFRNSHHLALQPYSLLQNIYLYHLTQHAIIGIT